MYFLIDAGFAVVGTRLGMLGGAAYCFSYMMLVSVFVTSDFSGDYGGGTLVGLGSLAAVAAFGFYTSSLAPHLQATPTPGAA